MGKTYILQYISTLQLLERSRLLHCVTCMVAAGSDFAATIGVQKGLAQNLAKLEI